MTKYIQTAAVVLCLCMVLWAAGLADGAAKKEEAEQALSEEKPLSGPESQKLYPDDPDWSRVSDVCVGGVLLRNYYVPRRMTVDETAKYFIDAYVTLDPENCPSGSWFSLCTRYDSPEEGPLDTTVPQVAYPAYEFDYGDSRRQLFVDGEVEWGATEDYLIFDYYDWYYYEADDGERIYTHAWHIGRYAVNRFTKEIVPWRIYREDESEAENVTIWEENEAYLAIIDHEFRVKESYDE